MMGKFLPRRLAAKAWWGAACLALGLLVACQTAPITGRSQFILIPESSDAALGLEAYNAILAESEISNDPALNGRVREVGHRIAAISPNPDFDWRFTVIKDDNPNAFALPGGKVGVNTGLFTVAKNDDQLAAVMAHEVGHAVARHGAERVSRAVLVQAGLAAILAASKPKEEGQPAEAEPNQNAIYLQVLAAAATLAFILPFSRDQESEADHIGIRYMAEAGYDPRQSVALWKNFKAAGGNRMPEFLSTHPLPDTRIQRLEALAPSMMPIYEANRR